MIGRLFGRGNGTPKESRDYIRILPYDGRKEVNFDKLFERQKVQDQIKRVREEIVKKQARAH